MNQPPTSTEQAKLFFFFILLATLVFVYGVGIPMLLITYGFINKMQTKGDFTYIATLRAVHKGLAAVATIFLFLANASYVMHLPSVSFAHGLNTASTLLIYPIYSFLFDWLFFIPAYNNKAWLVSGKLFVKKSAVSPKE